MITIITNKSKHKFQYEGNIEIYLDEPFLTIKADKLTNKKSDNLFESSTVNIIDKFWLDEIESIVGT